VFPEASLTGYYFPYVVGLDPARVQEAFEAVRAAASQHAIWVIVGTLRKTPDRYLNLAHVIDPGGEIVHEYAKAGPPWRIGYLLQGRQCLRHLGAALERGSTRVEAAPMRDSSGRVAFSSFST